MANQQRSSNIELLRLVLMVMIVLWHFIVHGMGVAYPERYKGETVSWLFYATPLLCYHVNTFVFISGWFGIKISLKKMIMFLLLVTFYGVLSYVVHLLINYKAEALQHFDITFLESLFIGSTGKLWFVNNYIFLMLIAPFINAGMKAEGMQRQLGWLLVILFVFVSSGFAWIYDNVNQAMNFVAIYMLARWMRTGCCLWVERHALLIFAGSVAGLFLHLIVASRLQGCINFHSFYFVTNYNHPLCITACVGLFFCFKRLPLGTVGWINWLSKGVFAAYLLTDTYLRGTFNSFVVRHTGDNLLWLVVAACATVLVACLFDKVRVWLMKPIEKLLPECLVL